MNVFLGWEDNKCICNLITFETSATTQKQTGVSSLFPRVTVLSGTANRLIKFMGSLKDTNI